MKIKALFLFAVLFLSGCATLQTTSNSLGSLDTFAQAAGADVGTTVATKLLTHRTELNPVILWCSKTLGLGVTPVGIIVCSVAAAVVAYKVLEYIDEPKITATATVIEFGMAARNILLINH